MQNPAIHDLLTLSCAPCAAKVRSALTPLGDGPAQVPRGTPVAFARKPDRPNASRAPDGIARG